MKKNSISTVILLLFMGFSTFGQSEFGVKLGIHSFELSNPSNIIFNNNSSIAFVDAKMGFQGGFYGRFDLGGIYIEPRLMLHSNNVEYQFNGDNGGIINSIKEETFTNLDIPLLFGFDVLFVDMYLGPVAHLNLSSSSDLFDIAGYSERFDTANYGYRIGFCVGLGNIDLTLEWEGNFSKFGDHINIGGQTFDFDDTPNRVIFNVGIPIF